MERSTNKFGVLVVSTAAALMAGACAGNSDTLDVEERNAEIIENLLDAGFDEDVIELNEDGLVFGEEAPNVFIDGDIHVSLEASRELLGESSGDVSFRHWRTPGLVTNNRTICLGRVVTTTGGASSSFRLTSAMVTGVNRANSNLNGVGGMGLSFKTVNATLNGNSLSLNNSSGCDFAIFIYRVSGGAGGSAGFPSGGAPNNQVRLNSGLAGFSNDVHEHVATHEIVHSIGLRHTDWKTRSSCGQNSNEGQQGASRISGTADQTTNSIMASCFSANSNGEFRGEDKEALGKIY